jgi:gas vesicle protein
MATTDRGLSIPQGCRDKDDDDSNVDNLLESSRFTKNDSIKFALRVSLALTLGSVFCLAFGARLESGYPDAQWVYITAGVVSWQSNPDTGSVFKKAWQRSLGTTVGGLLGLGVGTISLAIPEHGSSAQATYIGVTNSLITFAIVYATCEMGFRRNYSSILGTFTFGIVLLAFCNTEAKDAWRVAFYRIINILLGGIIGSVASLVAFPISTKHLVESKVSAAMKQAGETATEVLSAIGDENGLPSYHSIARDQTAEDPGHAAYEKGIAGVQDIRALLDLLKYDPFFTIMSEQQKRDTVEVWKVKLDRVLRIHVNIITLDNVVRGRLMGDDIVRYELLRQVGSHIAILLDDSKSKECRRRVALAMLNSDLPAVRIEIAGRRAEDTSRAFLNKERDFSPEKMMETLSQFGEDTTSMISELFSMKQSCLFYQMVEGLILRSIRLYHV